MCRAKIVFLILYYINKTMLIIIHILCTQKWASQRYSRSPCLLIYQNHKHDGRPYTNTSDAISTNRRIESLRSTVHAPLRSGKHTMMGRFIYCKCLTRDKFYNVKINYCKWYVVVCDYVACSVALHCDA